jgi:hypothetical protein
VHCRGIGRYEASEWRLEIQQNVMEIAEGNKSFRIVIVIKPHEIFLTIFALLNKTFHKIQRQEKERNVERKEDPSDSCHSLSGHRISG